MAHFVYPAGTPLGTVAFGYVVPHTDWQTVIQQLFKAANFDDGGTWAPGAFVTVGGAGFNLTGVNHTLAASARLNVESAAEIRLKNGALLKADGSGGDIRLEVLTNVATLTIQSGAVQVVNSGGAIDVSGGVNIKSGGSLQLESGGSMTLLSGATATMASGSTTNLSGSTVVRGTMTVKQSGGPGSILFEDTTLLSLTADALLEIHTAEATVEDGGVLTFLVGSNIVGNGGITPAQGTWSGYWTFNGGGTNALVFGSGLKPTLSPARAWSRRAHHLARVTHDTGVPQASDCYPSPLFDAPSLYIVGGSTSEVIAVFEIPPPPDGAILVSATVKSRGGAIALGTLVRPIYTLVRWQNGLTADMVELSDPTNDAHATNGSNWNNVLTTTVTADADVEIDLAYRYGIKVTAGYDVGSDDRLEMSLDVLFEGTVATLKGT